MRVVCRHGHFAFYPEKEGEVARFNSFFGAELQLDGDHYTFDSLIGLPRYSIKGQPYGGVEAIENFEGRGSWDVMRENGFVLDLRQQKLVPKTSVSISINPPLVAGDFFFGAAPLIQPGSFNAARQRVLSYEGLFIESILELRVNTFSYV